MLINPVKKTLLVLINLSQSQVDLLLLLVPGDDVSILFYLDRLWRELLGFDLVETQRLDFEVREVPFRLAFFLATSVGRFTLSCWSCGSSGYSFPSFGVLVACELLRIGKHCLEVALPNQRAKSLIVVDLEVH